jgi:hypothetical protein
MINCAWALREQGSRIKCHNAKWKRKENYNTALSSCIVAHCISLIYEIPNAFENHWNLRVVLVHQACPDDLKGFVTKLL